MNYQPHPYALMLPGLTEAEYAALKASIERFGILQPVITDGDDLILDGVHRCRIAAELGIDLPVSQMGQLTEQEQLHLAVGVNVGRRTFDADRRRELVHKLADEQGLSVREIAAATGWSKSTIGRDLLPRAEWTAKPKKRTDGNAVKLNDALQPLRRYLKGWTPDRLYGVGPPEARRLLKAVQEVDQALLEVERALEERTITSRALR